MLGTADDRDMLVGKRRRLLDYLKSKSEPRYRTMIEELGLRK